MDRITGQSAKARPKAFTLVELLVVIAVLAMLLAVLMPTLAAAKKRAKVTAVNAELKQIALALETYAHNNAGRFPPTYVSCMIQSHFYQLPRELTEGQYLPAKRKKHGPMSSAFEDRCNPDHTYKYIAPGDLVQNGDSVRRNGSWLYVPDGFPHNEKETGEYYNKPRESPVKYVVYSVGPNYDPEDEEVQNLRFPIPRKTWYDPSADKGAIVRIRLDNMKYTGSFE
ncbi:PilD-dependent protein PddA [Anaerohalosphaera lusitana]|uniref:PilD-dependent protein PddA n=1 Tax=Anaerohalosphaera lusitana TaxID=1936003 RepID=A0A1U9NQ60_9BACT|nr:type II secretion system protein [Anaerohalosphaera lusitana]AQT69750.1 PilD-dependent protein PddA [Anaerohalosphaera lusitana]